MAQERKFIEEGLKRLQIEEFLEKEFTKAGYSHSEIQRTPLAIRIVIYAHKPGLIIGRGGKNIDALVDTLKERFKLENPQLDIQEVQNPDLDPHIVAKQIALALERGLNYKRLANFALERVMNAGANGVAIRIGGKLGGEMGRIEKFSAGYLRYAGEPAEKDVKKAYARAQVKLGTIGIQVRIFIEASRDMKVSGKVEKEDAHGNVEEKTA